MKQKLTNFDILVRAEPFLINLGNLIKTIFSRAYSIDKSIYDMLNPADISIVDMKINKYTMRINDKKLEKLYNFNYQSLSLRIFRRIIFQYLVYGLLIVALNFIKDNEDDRYDNGYLIYIISVIGFIFLVAGATFTEKFQGNYYSYALYILVIFFLINSIITWFREEGHHICMYSVSFGIVISFNLNLGNLNIFLLNVLSCLNFIVKWVYDYTRDINDALDQNTKDNMPSKILFYNYLNLGILTVFHIIKSFLWKYKYDKLLKKDFYPWKV